MTTPEQFKRIEELFHRAIELSENERAAFLDAECGDDAVVRAKVESLLTREASDDSLPAVRVTSGGGDGPGDVIGPYRLVKRIGEGGMGVVFEAEQTEPVRRKVALKLIKWGMDTTQVVARFESERQALALMTHPNIARVYDAGATEAGRPYFVMEYVEGVAVTKYCDEQRLDTRTRLELFRRICDGLQHAHQKGIIHRDIKPSNILVSTDDGKAVPKIIDFGIAKATEQRLTEQSVYTELGQLVGTPEYMSPEQAELTGEDIDTRTDVYALGVVLYELLVGALPFDPAGLRKAGFDEIRRRIREDEPSRPSTRVGTLGEASTDAAQKRRTDPPSLQRQLRGDLDWIVMKALEKERDRRYDGASDLAADIARHLNHEPVLAGPPGVTYRTSKFVRRNRTLVAGVAGVLLALLAGIVVSSWFAVGQARARADAERQMRVSETISQFLQQDVLAAASPERTSDRDLTVREALDAASGTIAGRFPEDPSLEGLMHSTIGVTYLELGLLEPAERHFDDAIDMYRMHLGDEHPDTVRAINNLGDLYRRQGSYDNAEPLLLEAIETKRRVLGDEHESTALSIGNLGLMYQEQGRLEDAERLLEESLELGRDHRGDEHDGTMAAAHNLALLYQSLGRAEEAEELFVRNLETRRRVSGEDHPATLAAIHVLAVTFGRQGRIDEAVDLLRELAGRRREVLGDDHPDTLISMSSLATGLSRQGHLDEAASLYATVIEGMRRTLPGHWHLAMMLSSYGACLLQLERFDEAEAAWTESHAMLDAAFGQDDPRTARVAGQFVGLYEAWGRTDSAAHWRAKLPPQKPAGEP